MPEREPPPEKAQGQRIWAAPDLRHYLLALAGSTPEQNACLELQHFPQRIDLSPDWHQILDQMRTQTAVDGVEYWSFIGVTAQHDRVMVMRDFIRGRREDVSAEEIALAGRRALANGITHLIGDIHSHTASLIERMVLATDHFSPADLYGLLWSRVAPATKVLVGPNRNLVVCRSKDSELLPPMMNQKTFERLWEARFRWEYMLGNRWGADFEIGRRHSLVFYEGKPGQPLKEIVP
jgi:hypothetical protein